MTGSFAPLQADLLRDLIASGQAATDAKLEAIYRAVEAAQADAREARDTAKETAVVIREQNALARLAESRAEARQMMQALRDDTMAAQAGIRKQVAAVGDRIEALETIRAEGQGMARGAKLLLQAGKLTAAAGGGALMLKLFGG